MFEVLESTHNYEEAVGATRELVFKRRSPPETIELSLQRAEKYFEPRELLDGAARRELPLLYERHNCEIEFPDVLTNWKGDFREATQAIYEIAEGERDCEPVREYQHAMRSRLPDAIPLVRGVESKSPTNHPLTSWTAQVGTARLYGEYLLYTVARPEDVFMCALHGGRIGEQEFVLVDYSIEDQFEESVKSHVQLYQQMASVLGV